MDYGSILTSFSLYKCVESCGVKPYLIQKLPQLWGEHYADKNNIAGKFIYANCDVLEAFDSADDRKFLGSVGTHIVGTDVVWNENVVGKQAGLYFFLDGVDDRHRKISFGSSFGGDFSIASKRYNDCSILLSRFDDLSVTNERDAEILVNDFYADPEMVLDPVFLCDRDIYRKVAEGSAANEVEKEKDFIFTYVKNGDARKRKFILSGNKILLEKHKYPLRNFIDINRYPESLQALGLEAAYHICVDDWLHYLINSEFVITDDYYGMCMALLFGKPFIVLAYKDMPDISRYTSLLSALGLEERLVFMTDDLKRKEYLFRKPVKYYRVSKILDELIGDSKEWLGKKLGSEKS